MEKVFYTHSQVIERLRTSQATWWRLNKRGEGPPRIQVSNVWVYPCQQFEAWLANRQQSQELVSQ